MRATTEDKHTKASPAIAKLITHFEMSNLADGKSNSTITWYTDILKLYSRYLKDNMGTDQLEEFNIENARNYVLYLRSRSKFNRYASTQVQHSGLSPQTVRGHIRGLKAFSSWLHREQYTADNRLGNLKIPKAPVKLIEPLTDGEISQITSSINQESPLGSRNHAIFVTALDNGLRASEIANINLEQLDLKKGFIKVMGKGSKERIVPIGDYVKMTLWAYINKVRPEPTIAGCDNLFLSTTGEPEQPTMPPQIEVAIEGLAFNPATLNVPIGTTVLWYNNDTVTHTVTARDNLFDSGNLAPGDTFKGFICI
ncbi:tyrosine-type recombinase/integrase [Chloroflexota bacterium]